MLPMWKGKRNLTKGEWTRKALYQVGLVSGHSRNQVKRWSPDFSTSHCRERTEFHIWLTISKLCASWIFLIDFKSFSLGHVFLLQAFSLVLLTASVTVFLWLDHYLAGTKIQKKVSIHRKWDKNDFLTNVSVGPDLASALPVFLLSLSLSSLLLSGFSEILFACFSFSVVEILLSSFYFLFGKYALRFFVFGFEILISGFYFLFWKFCSQGFIFHFESFALRFFIFHFENLALLFFIFSFCHL